MRKTTSYTEDHSPITVDLPGLMRLLSVGRQTAEQIAAAAGASLKVGGRRLYNVPKIKEYIDTLSA